MYVGIDVGTSSVKVVLMDEQGSIIASDSQPLTVSQPKPLFSEQDPADWVEALERCMAAIRASYVSELKAVKAIGLTGQMHGAVCLDKRGEVLRPAILWNDGRSHRECALMAQRCPSYREISGNLIMPGFTAPKLLWLAQHEPAIFAQIDKVLLPKDYIRYVISGDFATDLSDASGTSWLNVKARAYEDSLLGACGLTQEKMPRVCEGTDITGQLSPQVAERWGMSNAVKIIAGAGDNAAGAVSMGVINNGQAMLSLGTSGVYFVANDSYRPNPQEALHTYCHAVPNTWHQMGVVLSAAHSLAWWAKNNRESEAVLIQEAEDLSAENIPVFLPYLSGERTPHNDALAKACFWGMSQSSSRATMTQAVLEGVAFAFMDSQQAFNQAGTDVQSISVIGGGAQSLYWGKILSSVLNQPLQYHEEACVGPAFGAAKLAWLGEQNLDPRDALNAPKINHILEPDTYLHESLLGRYETYRALYKQLKPLYDSVPDTRRTPSKIT